MLLAPALKLSAEKITAPPKIAKAYSVDVNSMDQRQHAIHIVKNCSAFKGAKARQAVVVKDAAFHLLHDEKGSVYNTRIGAVMNHFRDRHVAASQRPHDAIFPVDGVRRRQDG